MGKPTIRTSKTMKQQPPVFSLVMCASVRTLRLLNLVMASLKSSELGVSCIWYDITTSYK